MAMRDEMANRVLTEGDVLALALPIGPRELGWAMEVR